MVTQGIPLIEIVVWLIPLVLLGTIGVFILLVRHWKKVTVADLREMRGELRSLQSEHRRVILAVREYSEEDREPFQSRAATIHVRLSEIKGQDEWLNLKHVALQEQVRWLSSGEFQALIGAPYYWYQLRKEATQTRAGLSEMREAIGDASQMGESLRRLAWEVALEARKFFQVHQQAEGILSELRSHGLHGEALDEASRQVQETRTTLAQIPTYYLSGEERIVLEQADKESIISVHQFTRISALELKKVIDKAGAWQGQYEELTDQVAAMQRALADVESLLAGTPQELDVGTLEAQFETLKDNASDLALATRQAEVESLAREIQEAERVTQSAQEVGMQFSRGRDSLAKLKQVHNELDKGLKESNARCASLGTSITLPVVWGGTLNRLAELNRKSNQLNQPGLRRTPEQIENELQLATQLRRTQSSLSDHILLIEGQHSELELLLGRPEIDHFEVWLESARDLASRARAYAPENWPRENDVSNLSDHLDALAQEGQRLLPFGRPQQVQEVEVLPRLEQTRAFVERYQTLRQRAENIQARMEEVQSKEREVVESLSTAQVTLGQIRHLVNSNELLTRAAGEELGRLQSEIERAQNELETRQRGKIENQAKKVNSLLARLEGTANRWMDQLNQGIKQQVQSLNATLGKLDAIAPLEERPVAEARRLLDSSQGQAAHEASRKSRFRLEELVAEFKRGSDHWQRCAAAARELGELGETINESYSQANQARETAQQAYSDTVDWLRQRRNWPPTSVTLQEESLELERLEREWLAMRERPIRAIHLVRHLGDLSARYQSLTGKVGQRMDHAAQEMSQIEDIQAELDEAARQWQEQWYAYRDEPEASREIRSLLDEIDNQVSAIRRSYKQADGDYEKAVGEMKSLLRKVRYYQVALDSEHALDAAGNVHRRR